MSIKIFLCYAREDDDLLNRLKIQLKPLERNNFIKLWYDRDINAGTEWEQEVIEHLNTAQIILLLVSPDFMASDYCYGVEMKRAMERHERGEARVIPIILRQVYWEDAPFAQLQVLPTDAKPVKSWNNLDEAFFDIDASIRKVVKQLRDKQQHNQTLSPKDTQSSTAVEVTLTHQIGKDFMPVTGGSQVAYVLLEAKPSNLMAQVRMPLNFALVLDHSGSMKGAKLKNVKEAVKMVIDRLEPTDYFSVIIFDDTCQVIIPSMPTHDLVGIKKAAIDRISTHNNDRRYMSLGMIQGLNELRRWKIPNAVNRIILMTDGVTYGDSDHCRQLAREAMAAGISIYPIGIGQDWDESLLDTIGQLSGGMPAEFIRYPEDTMSIFEQQFQSAVDVAIRNATLTLHMPAGVTPKKAMKVSPIISDFGQSVLSDRKVTLHLGDLEKDISQSVLVELMIDPRPPGSFRIAQVELSYDVPIVNIIGQRIRGDIQVTYTTDTNESAQVNHLVMMIAEEANAHRLTTRPLDI